MKCLICSAEQKFFLSKSYQDTPYHFLMKNIGVVQYYKCENCGFTSSKTHFELSQNEWEKINLEFHRHHEHNIGEINQPPYLEQASLIKILSLNNIISINSCLDFACGFGTLSKILNKYFNIEILLYDPYVQDSSLNKYINYEDLEKYKTVINSALFEHIRSRQSLDEINSKVADNGSMIIHTVVCENIPPNPNWFYFAPPVHCVFHTNKSMSILMEQWGYESSIYCPKAKSWVLLKKHSDEFEKIIEKINFEFQTVYLIYKKGFVDYWKGF